MKTLELGKLDVMSMDEEELQLTFGGSFPQWLKKSGWVYLATQVIDNWAEVKQGFANGYKAKI